MTTSIPQLHRLCAACLLLVGCFEPSVPSDLDESTGGTDDPTVGTSGDPTSGASMSTSVSATSPDPSTTDPTQTTNPSTTDPTDPSTSTEATSDASSSEGGSESSGDTAPADTDGDGVLDPEDNCPDVENADQSDIDGDNTGDWCDNEVIDDAERLYIPPAVDYEMSGIRCYTGEVRIYGTVRITPFTPDVFTSGALILTADGRIWVAEGGLIDGSAAGYQGGQPSPNANVGGIAGSGISAGCGGGPGGCVGQAGSGGGYGGVGARPSMSNPNLTDCDVCSEPTVSHCGGLAGSSSGTVAGEDFSFGSGGGAGGNSCGCTSSGGRGGRGGGGLILVSDDTVRVDGTIRVDGEQPPADASACGYRPGGGGGSGGAIGLAAPTIEGAATGLLSARGGAGGDSPGDVATGTWGWAGGGGGGGRIKLFGDADDWTGATDVAGGAGGTAPVDANSYAGDAGGDGTVGTAAMIPANLTNLQCQ